MSFDGYSGIRLYRLLLRALPSHFRTRFGSEMEADFARRLRAAGPHPGSRAVVWWRALVDLLYHGLAERIRTRSRTSPPDPGHTMDSLAHDVRHALRSVRRSPAFTTLAVLTLALGIGSNVAVFTVLHGVLLTPLPYAESDRLVSVWPETNFNAHMVSRVEAEVEALDEVTGLSIWEFTLTGEADAVRLEGALVSPRHFSVLGVEPVLGRTFRPEEADPSRRDVVILSHGLWTRRYGADPDVLGRTIDLDGAESRARTIIGVLPAGYRPVGGPDIDVWVPLHVQPGLSLAQDDSWYVNRRVGRLAPGATVEEATAQLRAMALRLRAEAPSLPNLDEEAVRTASVHPLLDDEVGDVDRALRLLMAAVGLVLLVTCANVANLLLARGETRRAELAVRRALGAGQARILRQLMAESLLLALIAGVLGGAGAALGVRALRRLAPPELPRVDEVFTEPSILLFTLGLSTAVALLFGAVPALRNAGGDGLGTLGRGGRAPSSRARGRGLKGTLVALQVALAVILTFGAGLMTRSLSTLYSVDPGFRAEGILTLRLTPPGAVYGEGLGWVDYYGQVLEAVRGVPAVRRASAIHLLPQTASNWSFPIRPEGAAPAEGAPLPSVNLRVVRDDYFGTMEIPLLAGRPITSTDGPEDTPVVVVNRAFADGYWSGLDPVGREVQIFPPEGVRYRVVGVVGDVRQFGLDREPLPEMYVAHGQWARVGTLWLVVRTEGEPLGAAATVREAVLAVDDQVPVSGVDDLERVARRTAGPRRFVTWLLAAFGMLSILLGAVGVYGVTSYTVRKRLPEFGVRLALGAEGTDVLRSALARGMVPVLAGLAVGVAGALASGDLLAGLLYGVESRDEVTLITVVVILGLTGLLATGVPAVRTGRVDPARVLRNE